LRYTSQPFFCVGFKSFGFSGTVIRKLDQSYHGDKELYGREKFRTVMKELNLQGGIKLLEVLEPKEVEKIVTKCAAKG